MQHSGKYMAMNRTSDVTGPPCVLFFCSVFTGWAAHVIMSVHVNLLSLPAFRAVAPCLLPTPCHVTTNSDEQTPPDANDNIAW